MIDESYIQVLSAQLSDALRTIERLDAELKTLQIKRGQDSFLDFNTFSVAPKESKAPRAPFSVYYIDSSWKMYFPTGSFTYAGFAPSTVTPAVSSEYVPITWISSGNGTVYAHVQASVAEDGSISACDSISFDDTAANPAAEENKKTVTFKIAVVTDYLVDQISLGSLHFTSSEATVKTDDKSIGKNSESKLEVYGWSTQESDSNTLAALLFSNESTKGDVVIRSGDDDKTLKYNGVGTVGVDVEDTQTLSSGSDATASVRVDGETIKFTFGIPKGADGAGAGVSGLTDSVNVLTSIFWDTSSYQIKARYKTLTFNSGILTNIGNETVDDDNLIDTTPYSSESDGG